MTLRLFVETLKRLFVYSLRRWDVEALNFGDGFDDDDDYDYWIFVKGQADPAPTMIESWILKPETWNP